MVKTKKQTAKPTIANLPAPKAGGQAPLPVGTSPAKAPVVPLKTVPIAKPAPASAPKVQKHVAAKVTRAATAKIATQTIGPRTTAKVPLGTKVTTKTVTTVGASKTSATKKTVPAAQSSQVPTAPVTGTPAGTVTPAAPIPPSRTPPPQPPPTIPQRVVRWSNRYNWKRIIGLLICVLLLLFIAKNAKPVYQKVSSWFHGWNTPIASSTNTGTGGNAGFISPIAPAAAVEVITHDLSSARKIPTQSVGTIPGGSYVEQPVINLNITNSFNGSNNHLEFNYRSGNGNGSGNAVGNDCGNSQTGQPQYAPVPVGPPPPAPQTSQWYQPPPQDPPMQSSVVQAAPTYSAPYTYNASYSYVPPINFGFSWDGGYRGGSGCYRRSYQYNITSGNVCRGGGHSGGHYGGRGH